MFCAFPSERSHNPAPGCVKPKFRRTFLAAGLVSMPCPKAEGRDATRRIFTRLLTMMQAG